MGRWVKVSQFNDSEIYVNMDYVISMDRMAGSTMLQFAHQGEYAYCLTVLEEPEAIFAALALEPADARQSQS